MKKERIFGTLEELVNGYVMTDFEDVQEYENVMEHIENGKMRANFGSYEETDILRQDNHYFVKLRDFFEDTETDGRFLSKEEFNNLHDREFEYTGSDNSYNSGGNIERDINFNVFQDDFGQEIVLFNIHIGLDVRAGYTKAFAMMFEDEYSRMEFMLNRIHVAGGHVEHDTEMIEFSIYAQAFADWCDIDLNYEEVDLFEAPLDLYDKDDLIESIEGILKEEEFNFDKVVIH